MSAAESPLPLPPYGLMEFTGGPEYERIGNEFFGYLVNLARLSPTDAVLDIGSGCGRIAAPLTKYLSSGVYEGFEIAADAVKWCHGAITTRFPHFRFQHVDVFNGCYNRSGHLRPAEFTFPYQDSSFDVAIAASVFTHMTPKDTAHYLSEISRVLKPGGRLLATFFLLTERAPALGERRFNHRLRGGATVNKQSPEEAIAIKPQYLEKRLKRSGLIIERLEYGQWHRDASCLTFQDLLVCSRPR